MKLLIVGHARHGKDTVCEILRDKFGLTFESSSRFCSRLFLFDKLRGKYGYRNEEECYEDRANHRVEWYDLISEYNEDDASRLGKAMFAEYDIYCGLRNKREFFAMQNQSVFDTSIWVDRSRVLPPENEDSMTIKRSWAEHEIDNNGTLAQLESRVESLFRSLG